MPIGPEVSVPPKSSMLAAVGHDLADDLAEGERDDRDVVAAQPQRRHADQGAGDGRRRDGEREDEQEVDVDAGRARDGVADQDGDAVPVGPGVDPEARPEVGGRVRADREEGDVAEVEQAGEADDDVEPERHHHVGGGQDHVVEDVAARAEEQRRDRGEREHRHDAARPVRGRRSDSIRDPWHICHTHIHSVRYGRRRRRVRFLTAVQDESAPE